MGGRGEAEDDDLRLRVTEPGDGAAPVGLVLIGGLFLVGDLLPPLYEARTETAGGYLSFKRGERG